MKRSSFFLLPFLLAFALSPPGSVLAESDEECALPQELDKYHLLRRLSLDLNHRLPSYEALVALDEKSEVDDEALDALLEDDRFRLMARRFHEKLLWPSLTGVQLTAFAFRIGATSKAEGSIYRFIASPRKSLYRGSTTLDCLDEEQVEYIEGELSIAGGGKLAYRYPKPIIEDEVNGKPTRQEGYVWVNPYWNPSKAVKVCAYDAQDSFVVPLLKANGTVQKDENGNAKTFDCGGSRNYELCGAGPNLRWSWANGTDDAVQEAFREQLGLLVDDHTVGSQHTDGALPYSELLTTNRTYVNGTTLFFKKHLADVTNLSKTFNMWMPGDVEIEGEPDFTDEEWQPALRNVVGGSEVDMGHSGILTLPAFALRFQTNRARANRFRTIFTGQYFIPPDKVEDADVDGCSADSDDLTERCTCRGCHQVLEPMAAYWGGTLSEAGSGLISDRSIFPEYTAECDPTEKQGSLGPSCARFYVIDEEQLSPGVLLPYQFAHAGDEIASEIELDLLHQEIRTNLEAGPSALAEKVIASGQFHATMVKNIFTHLMGRELNLNPALPNNEIELWNQLADEFRGHDSFREIVKRIVLLEQYRRIQ